MMNPAITGNHQHTKEWKTQPPEFSIPYILHKVQSGGAMANLLPEYIWSSYDVCRTCAIGTQLSQLLL